jgi:L-aspartate oxidase
LATGGAGRLYRETTNPPVATGDGVAMAYRAGCEVRDLEFVQFHPTALYIAGSARHLITEAVRGEGAYLRDASGYRFMPDYHPQAELAPRDVVARAIAQQMVHTKHPCVYLDLTHLPAEFIRQRFPGITAVCAEFGLDVTREWIPVRPAAHYTVGGVKTDLEGRATLANLWACGEVASTGLHGANRLASNSLLEGLVFGALCGAAAAREAARMADTYQIQPVESPGGDRERRDYDLHDLTNSVRSLMGRNVAIERTADTLQDALRQLEFWAKFALQAEFDGPEGWELQNILTVAYLVTTAAWTRTESRGCHFRSDFPHTDDQRWRCHLTLLAAPNQR